MDATQIHAALDKVFNGEHERIVFWNDPEREFVNVLPFLLLKDVEILRLDEIGGLEAKVRIERLEPDRRFLLYSPAEEPEFDEDWLLDIRLYARCFRADRASILLEQLGLSRQSLREHLSLRRKFFDNKDRLQKLKQLVHSEDNESDLDRKMLAVVTRSEQPELFTIVRTIFHAMCDTDDVDLELVPEVWGQVEKFELDTRFWEFIRTTFGYAEESPSLRNLLIRLTVSDYAHHLSSALPSGLQNQLLTLSGIDNAVVCLAQWRDSSSKGSSYNTLVEGLGKLLHIQDYLHDCEIEDLLPVTTFREVDGAIIGGLLERISGSADTIDPDAIRGIVTRRQASHWVHSASVPFGQRHARHAVYEALAVAAELLALRNQYREGFDFPDATSMYRAYEQELYRFDQLYRHFCENADVAAGQSLDMLKPLREEIESVYANWFLPTLGLTWGKFVSSGLLASWAIEGIIPQYEFYQRIVDPWISEADKRRAFVVISDALRYEIAQELTETLNGTYRLQAELNSQLGVLPSYTALGMASLLPHATLAYTAKGDVLVDGKPTASLEQRSAALSRVNGIAVKSEALVNMTKEEGRDFVAESRVVYVYHDEIDARGDKAATESSTFDAARKAISDLADLVRYIVNNLNATYVVVTADHGFLFTESAPGETDKSKLAEKPDGTVTAKKRYLLGRDLPEDDDAWHGKTAVTAKADGEMEFWIPKGANRFHFTGGARFIHGGAMLQEIVVPVVTVKHVKDSAGKARTKTKVVTVQVLGSKHRITAQAHRFTLVQMDKVSERVRPLTLKIAVYEGDEAVSSIVSVKFDSSSDSMDERQQSVTLTLHGRPFNKRTPYRLVLRDADTGTEQGSVDVMIDRVIADDF